MLIISYVPIHSACSAVQTLDDLEALVASGSDLYLGEIHGTNEVPLLFSRLVNVAIQAEKNAEKELVVSLEKSKHAKDLDSWFWHGRDGRSSGAMWKLVQYLLAEESKGNLTLHFQHSDEVLDANMSTNEREEFIGRSIESLAQSAQVLILGGNIHSSKDLSNLGEYGKNLKTVGMFLGEDMIHVYAESLGEREDWSCRGTSENACGVQTSRSFFVDAKANTLIDGAELGHDFILFIPPSTASKPKYSKNN